MGSFSCPLTHQSSRLIWIITVKVKKRAANTYFFRLERIRHVYITSTR